MVERRHQEHRGVSQHHRDPDRDDRQPDADARAAGDGSAAAQQRPHVPGARRRSGTSGSRSTTRCPAICAILDMAAKMSENFLYNRYVMGKNSIDRGNEDTWTPAPHRYAEFARRRPRRRDERRWAADGGGRQAAPRRRRRRCGQALSRSSRRIAILAATSCRRSSRISRQRPRSSTRCSKTGINVHRATARVHGRRARRIRPARTWCMTNQAFRPHVIDMFEPQDHPDNFPYPGAPPTRPYDNAGWTLAYPDGHGVRSASRAGSRVRSKRVKDWNMPMPAGRLRLPRRRSTR